MRRLALLTVLGAVLGAVACGEEARQASSTPPPPPAPDLFEAADLRIGTGGVGFGVGSAYPGPAVPFALIHPGPDTRSGTGAPSFYHCSGYYAEDEWLGGFSLLHFHGTGVPDYGVVGFMPIDSMTAEKREQAGYMSRLDRASEVTRPGYYSVRVESGIQSEITSSEHAAVFRFTYPDGVSPALVVDLAHTLTDGHIESADVALDPTAGKLSARVHNIGAMSGRFGGFQVWAEAAFDLPPSAVGTFDAAGLAPGGASATGSPIGAWLEWPAGTTTVTMRVAVSLVDAEGARANLEAEAPSFDFDAMRSAAEAKWRAALGALQVHGASERDARMLGAAMYHALLMPTLTSDVDLRARDALGQIAAQPRPRYSDLSLWDTYRTLHPWLLLAQDPRNADFAATMVSMAREGGAVPVWALAHGDTLTMLGSPGEIVLAESAQKGVVFDDEAEAYELSRVAAFGPSPGPIGGRDGDLPEYLRLGWVPIEAGDDSVSKTQEYAVADAALARWATRLGRTEDAAALGARGSSWKNHWDPEVGFFRARHADGTFAAWAGPELMGGPYVEGDAWHYLWMVPHDPDGLGQTLGGREAALGRLREFFELSVEEMPMLGVRRFYWPSNEPDLSAPWFFAAWGEPGESRRWLDWIFDTLYTDGPEGIPGNDDGGTMSTWLLFAALGLYPLPGTDLYVVAAPRYPRVVLERPGGALVIESSPAPSPGLVPRRVTVNGEALEGPYIEHAQLVGETLVRFELAPALD
ncbi:MAG: GH92 family glycosyl hydrolase [Polyangiaceae bacterium]|nr:GH92 family glycosyl hydrolase [Polyangiaceae bacterium]